MIFIFIAAIACNRETSTEGIRTAISSATSHRCCIALLIIWLIVFIKVISLRLEDTVRRKTVLLSMLFGDKLIAKLNEQPGFYYPLKFI